MLKVLLESNRPVRLKVIRAVYENLVIKEGTSEYSGKVLSDAHAVYSLFSFLKRETKEHFIALHLDVKNRILCMSEYQQER